MRRIKQIEESMGVLSEKIKYISASLLLALLVAGCDVPNIPFLNNTESDLSDNALTENEQNVDVPAPLPQSEPEGKVAEDGTIILGDDIVSVNFEAIGRTSPFVPYKEKNLTYGSDYTYKDMPLPTIVGENDESLVKLVSAKVTGIIYDSVTPYAIINVLDNDYLVKIGDKIESFSITDIAKDYVAIKTGTNTYRAKVGDIIEGDINESGVYNVGHRFAGTSSKVNDKNVIFIKGVKKSEAANQQFGIQDLVLPPAPNLPSADTPENVTDIDVPPPSNTSL